MGNLALPGNPRYQPKDLVPIFGYDNLMLPAIEVELATMKTLGMLGIISPDDLSLLTDEVVQNLRTITTTQVDERERAVTKHDVRALVQLMQERMPEPLRRWVHVPLTSYDVLDTARILQFKRAYRNVVRPKLHAVIDALRRSALRYADVPQIGRTHGQHALPVTAGFWLATILHRMVENVIFLDWCEHGLTGKISGAVGAYNAQVGLGINPGSGYQSFEELVLLELRLQPASISTQILPPERLSRFLYGIREASAAIAQFANDCRHLMRTEIGEVREPFEKGQVGSSTMAHKRNPVSFEGVMGAWEKSDAEFGKVLRTSLSEHQRDLVGSSLMRDFPILVVNLVTQLDTLLRPGKDDARPLLERIVVDEEACARNLALQGDLFLAEPLYLALQMAGFTGDAHHVVNHRAMPLVGAQCPSLVAAVARLAEEDVHIGAAWNAIPDETRSLFANPNRYIGLAKEKTRFICDGADAYLRPE